ncbi:MAG: ABC transporter permease [Acidobacteriia bacterium]|nr:ABC transporter permease [Terriglobia bacterium]
MKSLAMRIYRRLAWAFPHEFQMVYGADVIQLGEDAMDDIWEQHGFFGLARLLADIAMRLPIEYLSEMRRDLAYALRTLAKSRGFAAVGVLSLGMGIGIATFSASEFFNLILPDAPGVKDPGRLAIEMGTSYPYFEHYRDQRDLFAGAAAYQGPVPFNVSLNSPLGGAVNSKAERVFGHLVSPEYFSVLGVRAARGRTFDAQVDRPGSAPVVFISDRFWRNRMDSDPDAVGRAIQVNGQEATIVGIGPRDFLGVTPIRPAEIFVPTTSPAAMVPELAGDVLHKRDAKFFEALFRLAPGVTLKSAEAGLDTITRHLDEESLDPARNVQGRRVTLVPGGKLVPVPREVIPLIFGLALLLDGLIVGIACMNLANMQLARATTRRREVAIRLSVGASRFRLIRQLLTESVLLACAGGVAGILCAYLAAAVFKRIKLPVAFPITIDLTPDWRAVLFTCAVSLAAGIGFGLAPALASTRADLAFMLKEGALAQVRGYRRFGMRNLLMVSQVAGSLMLLLITGFLIIGFDKGNRVDIAFDPMKMYLLSLDPVRDGYSAEKAANLFDKLPERLQRAPGAQQIVLAEAPPFSPLMATSTLAARSDAGAPDQVVQKVAKQTIGAGYFAALSVNMLEGREFSPSDQRIDSSKNQLLPVVLNETAAREFFGNRDPLGRRIAEGSRAYDVAGVVKDLSAPLSGSGDTAELTSQIPTVYFPLTRSDFAHSPVGGMTVMVRATRGADTLEGVRREIASLDPNLVMFNVRTLAEQVDEATAVMHLDTFFYGAIGSFGLILAAIGLAGVTAYSVARRRKEIGIRMALGARKGQVLRLVMREGGTLVMAGTLLGFLGAIAVSRALGAASSIFGPSFAAGSRDPRLLLGAPLLLGALAMLACYVPARRSVKIDPLIALREE